MRYFFTVVTLIASCLPVLAQTGTPTKQSGNVTPTHAACWTTNGVIQDCGTAAIPFLTSIGAVYNGPSICANTALPSSGAAQRVCLGGTTAGGAEIYVNNIGTASALPLLFNINGIVYQFPGTGNGNVVGPATTAVGDVAVWNNTSGTLLADVAVWGAVAPVGGLPLFAAPAATGTGTCLNSGNACTLATACSFTKQIATFLGPAGPINLANGTYTNSGSNPICQIFGNGGGNSGQLTSVVGNVVTPASVIMNVGAGLQGFDVEDAGEVGINGMQFQSSGAGGTGILCRQFSVCDYSNVIWSTWGSGGAHVSVDESSVNLISASGGCESITASVNIHWNLSDNAHLVAGCTTLIPSALVWGTTFIASVGSNYIDLTGWATSGSGVAGTTGQQASLSGPGYLATAGNASIASVLPGSANSSSLTLGFQGSGGDGMSGTGIVVGKQAPTIADPIITAHTYAGLPGSPAAGQISHIVDGLAANCGDGTCTTPNTTVTAGGGALDLLVGYDGAAWRIFRAAGTQATTGTGALVLRVSPTLVTPILDTPTSVTLNNTNDIIGGVTMTLGSDATGDIYYRNSSGVLTRLTVGSNTNVLAVSGGLPAWSTAVGGAMTYLCTITASTSASLNNASPTSGSCPINGSYTSYLLVFQNIVPATNEKILQLQIHSGGAFKATGYLSNNTVLISNTSSGGTSTTYIPISLPADANAASLANTAPGFSGNAIITTPSASALCMIYINGGYLNGNGNLTNSTSSGYWNTAGVVDGFQVLMDSGNITSGSILVYGIL